MKYVLTTDEIIQAIANQVGRDNPGLGERQVRVTLKAVRDGNVDPSFTATVEVLDAQTAA